MIALLVAAVAIRAISDPSVQSAVLASTGNPLRTWLELCSFMANIGVAAVAWFAVRFAKRQSEYARHQADEAEHSRAAQVYLQITGRYISPEVSVSRVLLSTLYNEYKADARGFTSIGAYFHNHAHALRTSVSRRKIQCYLKNIELLAFFEDVGVLVERKYVRLDDIRLIFRSAVLMAGQIYGHHIDERRKEAGTDSLFRNFTKLCDQMKPDAP